MADKGSQLGLYLREAREARGISLAQAATETRILQRYLVALEDGAYQHLPGDVYARGFIRNYAHYLQLPAEEMIELYRGERGATDQIKVVPAARPPRTRSVLVPPAWAVFVVMLALVVVGYVVLNLLGLTNNKELIAGATETPTVTTPQPLPSPTVTPTTADGSTAVPTSGAPTQPTAAVTPTLTAPVVVSIRITGQSWMQVFVDGVDQNINTIKGTDWGVPVFTAQREIRVKAGNAGAVEVSYNNRPFEFIGAPGAVVTKTYTPASD
ncbi:MAG TPA: RodZ domain-containing protein [Herpetosiphonaceae bacterium]